MFGTYQSFKAGGGQGTHCELPLVMWFGRQSGSPLKFESQRVRRSISNTNKQRYSSIYLCIYVYDYIHIYIYNYKRIKSFYICLNYLNLIYIYIPHPRLPGKRLLTRKRSWIFGRISPFCLIGWWNEELWMSSRAIIYSLSLSDLKYYTDTKYVFPMLFLLDCSVFHHDESSTIFLATLRCPLLSVNG